MPPFLVWRIGGRRTIGIVGALLQAGFEVSNTRLQRLDPLCLLLDDGEELDDQLLHDEGSFAPRWPCPAQARLEEAESRP